MESATNKKTKQLRVEEEKKPATKDSAVSRKLAHPNMKRKGEVERKVGGGVEKSGDVIVRSGEEEEEMDEVKEKSTTRQNTVRARAITQREIKEELLIQSAQSPSEAFSEKAGQGEEKQKTITIGSESDDGFPPKAPPGALDPRLADIDGLVDRIRARERLIPVSQEVPPDAENAANEDNTRTPLKPDWLTGDTAAELVANFNAHCYDDELQCIYEDINDYDQCLADTRKNAYVWAWLENGDKVEERERTPVEVIDVIDSEEEKEEAGIGMKRGAGDDGDEKPPLRKARIGEDLNEGD